MDNNNLGVFTARNTIIVNVLLCIFKILAGIIGKSSAMLADGVHTLSDVLATVIVIIGLKVSSKDADHDHPYGHEKYEPIFAKIISVILILTGFFIGYEGAKALIKKDMHTPGQIALIAAFVSIIIKEGMYWYTIKIAKKLKSISMEADAWHHRSDAFSSIGTFAGILGARMGIKALDPIAGIVVSIFIIKVGIAFWLKSSKELVDYSADDEVIDKIREIALSINGVYEINDLKTRIFGNKLYVDIEISVDGDLSVKKGHDIAQRVHDNIEIEIKDIKHCMVHVDPYKGE
ncbi:MAG: cation diffusion facilitator family transporter [Xylanivirga thermophila]|jgi:cation diffusion facilitator family transporter|uniref:cation diffusion facilitator family transporter n=1 Tax=Xylanivirga thermophila TaxID=2496273 RepID=UPI0039F62D58